MALLLKGAIFFVEILHQDTSSCITWDKMVSVAQQNSMKSCAKRLFFEEKKSK